MASNKTYVIDSFEKLLNVLNDDNFKNLTLDLLKWLATYMVYIKEVRGKYPNETEGKSNWEICEAHFEWIDDGKNDIKYIDHHNKHTGEVTRACVGK